MSTEQKFVHQGQYQNWFNGWWGCRYSPWMTRKFMSREMHQAGFMKQGRALSIFNNTEGISLEELESMKQFMENWSQNHA